MALRLLASFPIAVFLIAVLLGFASSYVSAIETSLVSRVTPPIRLEREESACDAMDREIREISRSARICDLDLQCLGSPILCPIALSGKQEREYLSLRAEFGMQCDGSYSLAEEAENGLPRNLATCGGRSSGEDPRGSTHPSELGELVEPTIFVF